MASSNMLVFMLVKMGLVFQENNTMTFSRHCWTEEIRKELRTSK
jgi:hypothetical protein